MTKLVAFYQRPDDPDAFDRQYFEGHLPLVRKMPGVRRVEITRFTGVPGGGDLPYYLMAELYFDDEAAMQAGMASPESREAGRQLMSFARGLVTMATARVEAV